MPAGNEGKPQEDASGMRQNSCTRSKPSAKGMELRFASDMFWSDDGKRLPSLDHYQPESVDRIVIDLCLEYLVWPLWADFLQGVGRVIRPGGIAAVRHLDVERLREQWAISGVNVKRQNDFFNLIYGSQGPRSQVRKSIISSRQLSEIMRAIGFESIGADISGGNETPDPVSTLADWAWFEKRRYGKKSVQATVPCAESQPARVPSIAGKVDSVLRFGLRTGICTCLRYVPGRRSKVNLGCGRYPLPWYINVDTRKMPWIHRVGSLFDFLKERPDDSLSRIHLAHVLEHLTYSEASSFLELARRKLSHCGELAIAVPDFDATMHYVGQAQIPEDRRVRILRSTLFGGQTYFDNYHFYAYSFAVMEELLKQHGFSYVQRREAFNRWPFWDSAELTRIDSTSFSLNVLAS